jgi:hypothetical protein
MGHIRERGIPGQRYKGATLWGRGRPCMCMITLVDRENIIDKVMNDRSAGFAEKQ